MRPAQTAADHLAAALLSHRPDAAAEAVRTDPTLTPTVRRLALDALLRKQVAAREEARKYLKALGVELGFASDVVAAVDANSALAPLVREEARHLARQLKDDPENLNRAVWQIVAEAAAASADTQRALRMASRAVELSPSWAHVNTLGVAQYRCSQHSAARDTLRRSLELRAKENQANDPSDVSFLAMAEFHCGNHSFLAMAEHQLGNQTEAVRLLELAEEVMRSVPEFRETESPFLAEARALIRGK